MTFGKYFERSNKNEKSTPIPPTTVINEPTLSTNTTIEASTPKSSKNDFTYVLETKLKIFKQEFFAIR